MSQLDEVLEIVYRNGVIDGKQGTASLSGNTVLSQAKQAMIAYFLDDVIGEDEDTTLFKNTPATMAIKGIRNELRKELRDKIKGNA